MSGRSRKRYAGKADPRSSIPTRACTGEGRGSQFTSDEFTDTPKRHGITILPPRRRREGGGAAARKEVVYLDADATVVEAKAGVGACLSFYNKDMWTIGVAEMPPLPPLREQARQAGKCSPSPPYPQASQPTNELISMG